MLLLEDLGPKSVPPWAPTAVRLAARGLAEFHNSTQDAATRDATIPEWLPHDLAAFGPPWERVAAESDRLQRVAALAGPASDAALAWLREALPALAEATSRLGQISPPYTLVHLDLRSDNLRLVNGQLRMFDWPNLSIGIPEADLAAFAQSVTVEGGPEPEQVVAAYTAHRGVRPLALDATIAALAAFFAYRAWQPDIPGLPRLRPFQRQQLRVCLRWAAQRLGLPEQGWIGEG